MIKLLKYSHPAVTNKYDLNKSYALDELQKELELEMIKVLFQPVNFEWKDLEVKKHNKKVEIVE